MRNLPPCALLFALTLAASGCGPAGAPTRPADPERARQVLRETLDAWKAGEAHAALAGRPTPVRVVDDDWLAGAKLVDYRLEPGDQLVGSSLRCPVKLKILSQAGKAQQKSVVYEVGTEPTASVLRQE